MVIIIRYLYLSANSSAMRVSSFARPILIVSEDNVCRFDSEGPKRDLVLFPFQGSKGLSAVEDGDSEMEETEQLGGKFDEDRLRTFSGLVLNYIKDFRSIAQTMATVDDKTQVAYGQPEKAAEPDYRFLIPLNSFGAVDARYT